ncbi:MAG: hypothetical protein JOZ13_01260 [Alphaproteobacteria bacterium]|nr:hypothetical protein [Alphaproteobacteria bacterium]
MLGKTIQTVALVALLAPLNSDCRADLPKVSAFIEQVRVEILGQIGRVREDLNADEGRSP